MTFVEFREEDALSSAYEELNAHMQEEGMKPRKAIDCINIRVPEARMSKIGENSFPEQLEMLQNLETLQFRLHAKGNGNTEVFDTEIEVSIDVPVERFTEIYDDLDESLGVVYAGGSVFGSGNFSQQAAEDLAVSYHFQIGDPCPWGTVEYDGSFYTERLEGEGEKYGKMGKILADHGAEYGAVMRDDDSWMVAAPDSLENLNKRV